MLFVVLYAPDIGATSDVGKHGHSDHRRAKHDKHVRVSLPTPHLRPLSGTQPEACQKKNRLIVHTSWSPVGLPKVRIFG